MKHGAEEMRVEILPSARTRKLYSKWVAIPSARSAEARVTQPARVTECCKHRPVSALRCDGRAHETFAREPRLPSGDDTKDELTQTLPDDTAVDVVRADP